MQPLVSCIMPTRGRPLFARKAITCFLEQNYPKRELIILDDEDDPSLKIIVGMIDGVRYVRTGERLTIAEKRNECCKRASGEIIMHWDDDDWSAPWRISIQVGLLQDSGKAVTGFHSMLFYDHARSRALKYINDRSYAIGTSLCYRKDWWQAHPFRNGTPDPNVGEDGQFKDEANNCGELYSIDADLVMVATIHPGNTSIRGVDRPAQTSYRSVGISALPAAFFSA